ILITAPAGFELSEDDSTYSDSLTLEQVSGVVADTTLYVRLYSATQGTFGGNITHSSGGADTKDVAVSGEVAPPSTTVVLQDGLNGYAGTRDTYIFNTDPSTVRGSEVTFVQDYDSETVERRSLLLFDLSSIPAGATIISADFGFYVTAEGQGFKMHRMLNPWDETTASYASIGNRHFAADDVDAESGVDATWTGHDGQTGPFSLAIPATTIQDWVDGTMTNNGWLMIATDVTGGDGQQLASREATTQANRPRLTIQYSTSTLPNNEPNAPVLVQPLDAATGVGTSPTLEVTVSDTDEDQLSVSFYGRPKTSGAEDFTLVVLPDTQKYANTATPTYYDTFYAMTQWIVDQADDRNIVFVTHVGDIVEDNLDGGWVVADTAYDILDTAGVPYSVGFGNNDMTGSDTTLSETYFGVSRFSSESWYGGHYGSDNRNNYSLFSVGGMDFILINLDYEASAAALDWADALLKANSSRRAIVESHDQLNLDDSWYNQAVFNALKDNPNLFLLLSGHLSSATDGVAKRTDTGDNGQAIYSVLQDYQSYTNVNNGYLHIYRFSPADDKIYMTTYSPTLPGYNTAPDSTLEFAYAMPPDVAAYQLIGADTDVTSGTNASTSWMGLSDGTEYEWYVVVDDGTDTTTGPTWSFTTA
ncbi:MAG: DNRLRE domain-containing protein, partial [Planctomycetes bacterium]|nr:DNRLRE domain-containing protein [Planctomycetota bacterium]